MILLKDIYNRINLKGLQHLSAADHPNKYITRYFHTRNYLIKKKFEWKNLSLGEAWIASSGKCRHGSRFRALSKNLSIHIKLLLMSSCLVTTSKARSTMRESAAPAEWRQTCLKSLSQLSPHLSHTQDTQCPQTHEHRTLAELQHPAMGLFHPKSSACIKTLPKLCYHSPPPPNLFVFHKLPLIPFLLIPSIVVFTPVNEHFTALISRDTLCTTGTSSPSG